eukprot:13793604-Alexandrium_andersonii.AAC.1
MAVRVVGRRCWAVLRALDTPHLGADPWGEGGALEELRQDSARDHGAPQQASLAQGAAGPPR